MVTDVRDAQREKKQPDQNIELSKRNQSVCCCDPNPSMLSSSTRDVLMCFVVRVPPH